jgi:predicted enzyme related to lactoylglutathione lyase
MKRLAALACAILLTGGAAAAQTAPPAPVAAPRVIMLRLYTDDFGRSERFYEAVFGVKMVQNMGDHAHILVFPHGATPGIILIKAPAKEHRMGSFVVQAPDLAGTLDRAKANGATLANEHFAAPVQGMPAQSGLFTDPDGNLVEVLQIGKPQ